MRPASSSVRMPEPVDRPEHDVTTPDVDEAAATVPETGDIVVDATLQDLATVEDSDLDATLAAGEALHATLTARLSDLGT